MIYEPFHRNMGSGPVCCARPNDLFSNTSAHAGTHEPTGGHSGYVEAVVPKSAYSEMTECAEACVRLCAGPGWGLGQHPSALSILNDLEITSTLP